MSKIEEIANKYCESSSFEDAGMMFSFIAGYKQAEKDNELTLEDLKTIDKLLNQCVDYRNPYQEVLKRFKEIRQLCQNHFVQGASSGK